MGKCAPLEAINESLVEWAWQILIFFFALFHTFYDLTPKQRLFLYFHEYSFGKSRGTPSSSVSVRVILEDLDELNDRMKDWKLKGWLKASKMF